MSTSADANSSLELCKYLWQEYEYRHDLIWRLIFKFTSTIVLLSIVPYVQVALVDRLGIFIIGAPVLAVFLASFGLLVMNNELDIFGKIKKRYRKWQNQLEPYHPPLHDPEKMRDPEEVGDFSKFVKYYFAVLIALSLINLIFLLILFPNLGGTPSATSCLSVISENLVLTNC